MWHASSCIKYAMSARSSSNSAQEKYRCVCDSEPKVLQILEQWRKIMQQPVNARTNKINLKTRNHTAWKPEVIDRMRTVADMSDCVDKIAKHFESKWGSRDLA